jgi:phosphonate transport system substrate-binding protein
VVEALGEALEMRTTLQVDPRRSGPLGDHRDPFAAGEVDLAFLCAPSYLWLRDRRPPSVELVPAAPIYDDPRGGGRPVYFSELVTCRPGARGLDDLRGATWAYNDTSSLSGYSSVLGRLGAEGEAFFGDVRCAGSHLRSLELVQRGEVDVAAIDSHVLALQRLRRPELRGLRVLESLGPFPVQPVVARRGLPRAFLARVTETLLGLTGDPRLTAHGVRGFAPVDAAHYDGARSVCRAAPLPAEA